MRILGVDPGTAYIGYGVVETQRDSIRAVAYGRFRVKSTLSFPEKLKQIYDSIINLIAETEADIMAVENVFVSCNAKTSLKLGHARGVILLAAAHKEMAIFEYAPREIKQAVLGKGNASKSQVEWMVNKLLNLENIKLEEDAADGLAVAICHGFKAKSLAMLKEVI